MPERHISISYNFRPDEPSGGQESEIRRAFAALGWKVTQYGGGSSNVNRCYLDIESADQPIDHPTLITTLKALGIPLAEDPSNHTDIHGDVSMERRSVEWAHCREADIDDVHLEVLGVTPSNPFEAEGRLIPQVEVRCVVSPRGNRRLRFPLGLEVAALGKDDKPSSRWVVCSGSVSRPGEIVFEVPMEPQAATVDLLMRVLDIHRAGEAVFRVVPVLSSRPSSTRVGDRT